MMVEKKILIPEELERKIKELAPNWKTGENERRVPYIERIKHASTYMEGIDFVNKLAAAAEANNHHPDIHINYKRISVKYWTHSSGGVTLADVQMAQKIDLLF
jgi:4a-hydroxytetrahydrobiopterin dehydratase